MHGCKINHACAGIVVTYLNVIVVTKNVTMRNIISFWCYWFNWWENLSDIDIRDSQVIEDNFWTKWDRYNMK